ncbi:CoA transferase subunit A [Ruminococcaceae bacterium OttesenSCG-928-O06]|nr:CoA transferase subunit A [Ruminococcaceae bacterium OttesenSCG-928-O06]
MKDKRITVQQAGAMVPDNATVMVGGFIGVGAPDHITDELVRRGTKDLTVIANDTSFPGLGLGKMVERRQIKKFIGTHIGTNPETGRQMSAGEMDVTLIPQGTMVEKMRAAGYGLGGVLTGTGLGTLVAEGKQTVWVNGKEYLLEEPLGAEIALIYGTKVDEAGNVYYEGTTRNFNVMMSRAAKTVIVEAEEVVPVGGIDPNHVVIPGIFIDYIVEVANNG